MPPSKALSSIASRHPPRRAAAAAPPAAATAPPAARPYEQQLTEYRAVSATPAPSFGDGILEFLAAPAIAVVETLSGLSTPIGQKSSPLDMALKTVGIPSTVISKTVNHAVAGLATAAGIPDAAALGKAMEIVTDVGQITKNLGAGLIQGKYLDTATTLTQDIGGMVLEPGRVPTQLDMLDPSAPLPAVFGDTPIPSVNIPSGPSISFPPSLGDGITAPDPEESGTDTTFDDWA